MDDRERFRNYQPLFGSWKIEEEIGEGSFGTVYRVSKEELGKRYESAVKHIQIPTREQYREAKDSLNKDAPSLNRYFRNMVEKVVQEVEILHDLSGKENILTYHDHQVIEWPEHDGWDILIRMEYSTPLTKHLEMGSFTREQVIRLGIDIANALQVCKGHAILHRDVKEANIFVGRDGAFKLGDFGIAKSLGGSSRAGSMRGTPMYMAPEIFRNEKYDARVDLYSLGLVLYRLTNDRRLPFMPAYPQELTAEDIDTGINRRLRGESMPMPTRAGSALGKVILKACAYRQEDRYPDAVTMRKALEEVLAGMHAENRQENLLVETREIPEGAPIGTIPGWDIPKVNEQPEKPKEEGSGTRSPYDDYPAPPPPRITKNPGDRKPRKGKRWLIAGLLMVALVIGLAIGQEFLTTPTLKPKLPKVGDTLTFGQYEQDNNYSNGKEEIAWRVLKVEEEKALLISKNSLDCQPYNREFTSVTWEICMLRGWLNGTFLNAAFTPAEQKAIVTTSLMNDDNPAYNTYGGKPTQDRVFLLSIAEAEKLFSGDGDRVAQNSAYAKAQGAYTHERGTGWWWLRSPGGNQGSAASVYTDGSVYRRGTYVDVSSYAVRPALWLDLSSL